MVKINNKRKLKYYLKDYDSGKSSQKSAAKALGITPRRFRQIHAIYKSTGEIPAIGVGLGRPRQDIPEKWKEIIKQEYEMFRLNALYQEKTIYARCKIRIPHNTIHKVMLEFGFAKEQESKQKRRKPWIRYERKHSLSAVHIDWHLSKVNGKQLCSIIDDASRKLLSAGEFDNATEENSLKVLNEAIERNSHLYPIMSIISDHGSQFYANKRDKNGYADHAFEIFLKDKGIKQILCGVNHPQTNGKQEKFHDFYKNHRGRFESLDKMIEWYNNRPHGSLNLRRAETPNQAFIRKMHPEVWLGFAFKMFGW
ncbi:MAG: DDE-type integrase/transposase/recombinase [Flavisolibacter sp.]